MTFLCPLSLRDWRSGDLLLSPSCVRCLWPSSGGTCHRLQTVLLIGRFAFLTRLMSQPLQPQCGAAEGALSSFYSSVRMENLELSSFGIMGKTRDKVMGL